MSERRSGRRQRSLKGGTIAIAGVTTIDCVVRDLSSTGACLQVESAVGIPDEFTLIVAKDDLQRPCRVAWRSAKRIGIRFV